MSSPHVHDRDLDLALEDDEHDLDFDPRNPYASGTRWRHEESSQFRKHAGHSLQPRSAEVKTGTHDLADFLNSSRIAPDSSSRSRPGSSVPNKHTPITVDGQSAEAADEPHFEMDSVQPQDGKTIACGPLLNYRRMEGNYWVGSVLVVTQGGGKTQEFIPTLILQRVCRAQHIHTKTNGVGKGVWDGATGPIKIQGQCLYSDRRNTFWRFNLRCEMEDDEIQWEYSVPELRFISKKKPQKNNFYVPAIRESMRSMAGFFFSPDFFFGRSCLFLGHIADHL